MEFWTTSLGLSKMRPMPNALPDGFANFVSGAVKAEELGFDGYGSGEHHFMYDEFIPIPLQAMAA
ncbi:MAG: LLM class flavin-dependent oxidoreductase, partial [bacterium]|nr:LLM class flavin-dependent oxidoreductase [bacterium]